MERDAPNPEPPFRVTLDRMRREDLPEVLAIERASFIDPWAARTFETELTNDFSRPLVARDREGRVIGYSICWVAGPEVHVLNIAVRFDYRRHGVGRVMMERVIRDARGGGAELITLEVRPSNTAARAFYAGFGFARVGLRRRYYSNGEDAELLLLQL